MRFQVIPENQNQSNIITLKYFDDFNDLIISTYFSVYRLTCQV